MASLNLDSLTKEQLAMLARASFGQGPGDDTEYYGGVDADGNMIGFSRVYPKASSAKKGKGPTYGGASLADVLTEFQDLGGEQLLKKYGRSPDIKWGY